MGDARSFCPAGNASAYYPFTRDLPLQIRSTEEERDSIRNSSIPDWAKEGLKALLAESGILDDGIGDWHVSAACSHFPIVSGGARTRRGTRPGTIGGRHVQPAARRPAIL